MSYASKECLEGRLNNYVVRILPHTPFLGGNLHSLQEEIDGWERYILLLFFLQTRTLHCMPKNMVRDFLSP